MLHHNDKKVPGASDASPLQAQQAVCSLPRDATTYPRDLDQQLATRRQIDTFLEKNVHIQDQLNYAEPIISELAVVRLALALADFVHPTAAAEQVILLQTEQIERALQCHNAGGRCEEMAQSMLCPDLFPAASQPLVEELRAHVLLKLHASRYLISIASEPRPGSVAHAPSHSDEPASKPAPTLSPAGLATVFAALQQAGEKVVSDFSASSIALPASDVALRERCELVGKLLTRVRYLQSSRELFNKPQLVLSGVDRHFNGYVQDQRAYALRVFEDVAWVGLCLAFNGYPEDVVASGMLAHAHNSIRDPEGEWLREASIPFPGPVGQILSALQFGSPDPIGDPSDVSPLSCQRPLTSNPGAPGDISRAAQAIAATSMLSPAHQPTLKELLGVVPFLRDDPTPHSFVAMVRYRLGDLAVNEGLGWNGSPRNLHKKKRLQIIYEISATLEGLREHLPNSSPNASEYERIREMRYSFNLAFRVAARLGSIRNIHEAFTDPFFGPAAQASAWEVPYNLPWYLKADERGEDETEVGSSPHIGPLLRELSDEDAQTHIERIATRITGRIRPEHIHARWQHRVLASLDFSSQPEDQRYRDIVQHLSGYCSTASASPQSAADFLSSRIDALTKSVTASLVAIKHRHFQFFELDVELVLARLQLELLRSGTGTVTDETGFRRAVSHFAHSEVLSTASRWDTFLYARISLEDVRIDQFPQELYTTQQVADFCRASDLLVSSIHSLKQTASSRGHVGNVRHSLEVGMTLAICGAAPDVVVAGILHDLYEHLSHADRVDPLSEPRLPAMRAEVRRQFGRDVDHLIELVSEPRITQTGSERPFLSRKMAIFRRVQMRYATDPVLARKAVAVLLAAKVSTLNDGLAQLAETGDPRPWSKGDYFDNVTVMTATRQLASSLSDNNVIMVLFDRIIVRWIAATWSSRAPRATSESFEDLIAGAQKRSPFALEDLGLRYLSGLGVGRSPARAAMLIGLSDSFFPTGQTLKEIYASAPAPTDTETERAEVLLRLRERAHRRDVWAEYQLGLCHLHGWGVQSGASEALRYFSTAIENLDRLAPMIEGWAYARQAQAKLRPYVEFEIAKIYESGAADMAPDKAKAIHHFCRCKEALLTADDELRSKWIADTPQLAAAVYAALAFLYENGPDETRDTAKSANYLARAQRWWQISTEDQH